jgi:hypothetical protein
VQVQQRQHLADLRGLARLACLQPSGLRTE